MMWFVIGLLLGKWITGSWIWAVAIGIGCSMFLGNDDPDDDWRPGHK